MRRRPRHGHDESRPFSSAEAHACLHENLGAQPPTGPVGQPPDDSYERSRSWLGPQYLYGLSADLRVPTQSRHHPSECAADVEPSSPTGREKTRAVARQDVRFPLADMQLPCIVCACLCSRRAVPRVPDCTQSALGAPLSSQTALERRGRLRRPVYGEAMGVAAGSRRRVASRPSDSPPPRPHSTLQPHTSPLLADVRGASMDPIAPTSTLSGAHRGNPEIPYGDLAHPPCPVSRPRAA